MIYIYDILLNFCDCDEIYDFYEWNSTDSIENIKRIKLVHVSKEKYDDLLYYDIVVDNKFLLDIFHTCEVYTSKRVKVLDYCALFSDGDRVLAIEFDKTGKSIYKSKLLIDEEEEIAILANNLENYNFNYNKNNLVLKNRFFTRNEIVIRNYLLKEIEDSYNKKNYSKLCFLYEEYFNKENNDLYLVYKELISSLDNNLDKKHKNMYQLLKMINKKKQV